MMLPFNIQLKGVAVGLILAYFLIPWIQSLLIRSRTTPAAA